MSSMVILPDFLDYKKDKSSDDRFIWAFYPFVDQEQRRLVLTALTSGRHLSFLLFDHFFDHIAADRSVLFGGKISIVSIGERHTKFICYFKLKTIQGTLCFWYNCFVRRSVVWHSSFPPWLVVLCSCYDVSMWFMRIIHWKLPYNLPEKWKILIFYE